MRTFYWVSGELTEAQRFINVPMRWCEQYPARERRELWITAPQRLEVKLVVHTRAMPARRGHQVLAVLYRKQLVGLRNLTTGEKVNFVRNDPPLLWRRCDGVALALLAGAAALAWGAGWAPAGLVGTVAALVYAPAVILRRWLSRCWLAREVERAIDTAQWQALGQRGLRLVK